jgi:hypothetical protein
LPASYYPVTEINIILTMLPEGFITGKAFFLPVIV